MSSALISTTFILKLIPHLLSSGQAAWRSALWY